MPKFSVKKPFVVLVGVVMLLVLGFVSFTKMTTDFMPNMNMPYMIVITTYPGASPEKVESEVSGSGGKFCRNSQWCQESDQYLFRKFQYCVTAI